MSARHTPGPWAYDGESRVDAVQYRAPTVHICDDGTEYIGGLVALPYGCGEGSREANGRLIAAAPELLAELAAAHKIIRNALNIMTTEQKVAWAEENSVDGVDGDGITRANEREAVIAKVSGTAVTLEVHPKFERLVQEEARLRAALNDIAFSNRTKTGLKELAKAALFPAEEAAC